MFTHYLRIILKEFLWELKAPSGNWFPRAKFLIMFIGVVVGPLLVITLSGLDSHTLGGVGLAWSFLPIALLLLISISGGFWMFRHESHVVKNLSIS